MKALLVLMTAFAFSGAAFADDNKEDRLASYDADGDGQLSREEAAGNQELSARFDEIDANGDGLLGEDEIDEGPIDDFDEIGEDPLEDDAEFEEAGDESEAEEEVEEEAEDWNA